MGEIEKENIREDIRIDNQTEDIIYEKLSVVDENYLVDLTKKWMYRNNTVITFIFCVLFIFLLSVIQVQNKRIESATKQVHDMNQVVVQLTKLISDSSLTELFQNTYESTIGEIRKDFTSIQKQADEDHQAFVSYSYTLKRELLDIKQQAELQTTSFKALEKQVHDLSQLVSIYDQKVNSFSSRVLYDGTDRIDYAYEKNGGSVLKGNQWTSSPPSELFSSRNRLVVDPSIAINPPTEKGYCYPMTSTNTRFTVKIPIPRNPSIFSMDHISKFVTENRFTAPKYYDIWGFEMEESEPVILATNCYYDLQGEQTQYCSNQYVGTQVFTIFQMRIKENWGAGYTCLYRFRVH